MAQKRLCLSSLISVPRIPELTSLSSALDEKLRSLLEWSEYVQRYKYTSITDKGTNIFVKYEGYC